ncbi:MAG: GNAT family protein [Planctomycetota bacterium]
MSQAFADRLVTLRDKARVVVRALHAADADAVCAHLSRAAATTDQVLTSPGETMSAAALRRDFDRVFDADRGGIMLGAFAVDDPRRVVGHIGLAMREKKKVAHMGSLGMIYDADWRGRGLGAVMLEAVLGWARAHPRVLRVELEVLETNVAGLALYRRCGFERDGLKRRAFRQDSGEFVDVVLMSIWVGAETEPRS